jgi:hypothetical protein
VSFHLSYAANPNKPSGKSVETQLPNYGRDITGTSRGFNSVGIGVGYFAIDSSLHIGAEILVFSRSEYTSFSDRRFSEGGYYLTKEDEGNIGMGCTVAYVFRRHYAVFVGYGTERQMILGFRLILNSSSDW